MLNVYINVSLYRFKLIHMMGVYHRQLSVVMIHDEALSYNLCTTFTIHHTVEIASNI